jgi:hypothetical protein
MSIALALAYSMLFATGPTPPLDGLPFYQTLCVAQLATLPDRSVRIVSAEERVVDTAGACFVQPGVVLLVRRAVAQSKFLYSLQLALGDAVPMSELVNLVVATLSSMSQTSQKSSELSRTAFGWSLPTHAVVFPFSNRDLFNAMATNGVVRDDVYLLGVSLAVSLADVRRVMPFVAERSGLSLALLEDAQPSIVPLQSFVALLVRMAESVREIANDDEDEGESLLIKSEVIERGVEEQLLDEVDDEKEREDEEEEEAEVEEKEVVPEVGGPSVAPRGMRPRHRPTGQRKDLLMPVVGLTVDDEPDEPKTPNKDTAPRFFA